MPERLVAAPVPGVPAGGRLGESPLWTRDDGLLWVDIGRRLLHRWDPAHGHTVAVLTDIVTAVAETAKPGRLVGAGAVGFVSVEDDGSVRRVGPRLVDHPDDRMNDGACDPRGRFWAGSMVTDPERNGRAGLWALDAGGQVHQVLDGITESNGLAWTTDGDAAYYVDTATGRIDRLEFDESGLGVTRRSTFAAVAESDGVPDGLAVDADGGVWVALWGGGRVRRYRDDGAVDIEVEVAAPYVTSCAFVAAELFVTSATEDLDERALAAYPLSGAVFRVETGRRGAPVARYGGDLRFALP
jgi:sugar lactone lactonase YvrE